MRRRLPNLTEEVIENTSWVDRPDGSRMRTYACAPEDIGDFYWDLQHKRRCLVVALPTKHGMLCCSWSIDHKNHSNAQWSWDGDEDAPTLSPSLHAVGLWHGWVKKGHLHEA